MRSEKFDQLYRDHRDRIFAFLVYRTGNRALAEDMLGDVFERALKARFQFDPRRGSETTWLYAIALNRLRDERRRAEVERRAVERYARDAPLVSEAPDSRLADRDRVMRSLELLSAQDRELVALRFGADLTVPQIAKVTGTKITTVEGRLYRALRRIRAALEPEEVSASGR